MNHVDDQHCVGTNQGHVLHAGMAGTIAGSIVDVFVAPESAIAVGAEDHAAIWPAAEYGQHVLFGQQGAGVNAGYQAVTHVDSLRVAPVGAVVGRPGHQQGLVEVLAAVLVDVTMDAGPHEHGQQPTGQTD